LLDSTLGDGAVRVALTTASNRKFHGSDLTPQLFLMPPAYPNDQLELVSQAGAGNYRKALNRSRGRLAV
jgi:hypothetical protein